MERGVYNIRTGISHGTSMLTAICDRLDNVYSNAISLGERRA